MKTFSIALGQYVAGAAPASLSATGTSGPHINQIEQAKEARDRAQAELDTLMKGGMTMEEARAHMADVAGKVNGEGAMATTSSGIVQEGDTLTFDVDGDDYSVCVLTVTHADGSTSWAKWHRNGGLKESGSEPAPPIDGGDQQAAGTEGDPGSEPGAGPASLSAAATDPGSASGAGPDDRDFSGSHSGSGKRRSHRY